MPVSSLDQNDKHYSADRLANCAKRVLDLTGEDTTVLKLKTAEQRQSFYFSSGSSPRRRSGGCGSRTR